MAPASLSGRGRSSSSPTTTMTEGRTQIGPRSGSRSTASQSASWSWTACRREATYPTGSRPITPPTNCCPWPHQLRLTQRSTPQRSDDEHALTDEQRAARLAEITAFWTRTACLLSEEGSASCAWMASIFTMAFAIPSNCLSRRRLVSNSAKTPSMSRNALPAAVLVSMGWSAARKKAPFRFSSRTMSCRSPIERASRSIRVTTNSSPRRINSRTEASSLRPVRVVPVTFSERMISHPTAFNRSTCALRSWSVVDTLAYPLWPCARFLSHQVH